MEIAKQERENKKNQQDIKASIDERDEIKNE